VAIYGMGLQGWDGSMQFAWDHPGTLPHKSSGVNDTCNDFGAISQYPALARLVRRGDVREGAVVGNRRISLPALCATGDVGFIEQFSLLGGANNKSFDAAVPSAALAAGRVVLEFVDGPVEKPVVDTSAAYIDANRKIVRSTTGQLAWDHSGRGFITVDTPGTKAVIGHCGIARARRGSPGPGDAPTVRSPAMSETFGQPSAGSGDPRTAHDPRTARVYVLGEVTIAPKTPFCNVYVTAPGKEETIADAKSLLITATARMVDKETLFDDLSERPLVAAPYKKGPVVLEPVTVTIELKRKGPCRVFALDHGGRKTEPAAEVPAEQTADGCRIVLDGMKYRTPYYVMEFETR
jgi:hypothetical protein